MKFLLIYVPNLRFSFEEDWCTSTIGENFRLSSGLTPSTKEKAYFNNGIIPWINSGELKNKYISFTENKLTLDAVKKHNLTIYPMDTMVIAIYGLEAAGVRGKASITKMDSTISQSCMAFNSLGNVLTQFMYYVYKKEAQILGTRYAQGTKQQNLSSDLLSSYKLLYPSKEEQLKIVNFLSLIDEKIETQSKIIDTLSSQKKQIRNLLFKNIHKNANCCIQDYVIYEQPQKYIVHSTDYLSYGKDYTPVLTANQSFILGYTLEKDGIYEKGDCIIFDDFTNENKYVDFPFKVKSSALKILQTKGGLMLKFFYEYLQFLNFESTDHKRHYLSEVAVTDISVPNLKEQTFVCKIFTSFDNKLRNEKALLEKYRLQKQFLLNNLFI